VTPHHRRSFITTKRILEGEQTSFDLFGEETSDVGPVAVPVEVVSDALIEVPVPA
jgi:hypothetical protein